MWMKDHMLLPVQWIVTKIYHFWSAEKYFQIWIGFTIIDYSDVTEMLIMIFIIDSYEQIYCFKLNAKK